MVSAPSGTVTFLFTDIQGSTRLWQDDPAAMEIALKRHDEILRKTINQHNGHVFKTVGDAFCCAFAEATDAVKASLATQLILREEEWQTSRPIRVRMSLHTGAARERDNDYFGPPVNRVARIESLAHGGQVVMSRATAELVRDLLPEGVWIEDKGAHRLKDLARPEEIFQINHPDLPTEFPPLKSMDVLPNNLPVQTTPLIGREKELESINGLYSREDCRLVSLIGPGGMGKTRLALQVAADLVDRNRDGTWFVDLTAVTQPRGVALETAIVLGIPQIFETDPVELVADVLSDKEMLIVLDNFEQVMSAFQVVVTWLKRSPGVKFLVTSREPLNIRGEHVFQVPPLSLPKPGKGGVLSQFEATRLFIDRACASKPDFTVNNDNAPVVAEICSRLDGIPLAIELAAARIRLINPKAILKRLDTRLKLLTGGPNDMPDRHKTLRACIDWSYDLLAEEERAIYRHISVFRGGISLAAATAVLEPVIGDELEVLDGIESLVDKSLVFRKPPVDDEPFFGILETIGEYGRARLIVSEEEDESLDRHAGYFISLVMNAREAWDGPEQKSFIDKITANQENIRHAMKRLVETDEGTAIISMTRSLVPFWIMRSEFATCREWLLTALELCPDSESGESAWLTMQMGWLSWAAGNIDEAEHYLCKSLSMFRENNDEIGLCYSNLYLSQTYFMQGEIEKSEQKCEEIYELLKKIADQNLLANVEHVKGNIETLKKRNFDKAIRHYSAALEAYESGGNDFKAAIIVNNLGTVDYQQGDYKSAELKFKKALPILEKYEHYHYLRYALCNMGELCLSEKRYQDALRYFENVKNKALYKFDYRYLACAYVGISESYIGMNDIDIAEQCAQEAIEVVRRFGKTVELGMAQRVLGEIAMTKEEYGNALEYFESAERILTDLMEMDEVEKVRERLQDLSGIGG